ncbi:uncharacterized protein EAF01_007940 [Botrytis porri]|uniref:Uncharacterized protein n=1 Tax=Botrytis porri TaxID=87229 RepID=A0A4Z1KNU3_9HELO|nr:uncharacterized protein EAF01_007940 [Botrytis porri]KAF7900638.1 hypothetical protein EAF01_007940 [Botrytis porri]TGO82865.1 hypothetical protein BPOR_0743g00050 [Botrytis porri]
MPTSRGRRQKFSSQEDAYLSNFREWRNEEVSESWAQFLARYEKKFWADPHSSASLFYRAEKLSGHRHQTLSRVEEMMHHMLKMRKSSILWTWGRIGQAFGTNARTASAAYKNFLERNGIDEDENESRRIMWTESDRRRLGRARHLGYSWERISKQFGHEEYICMSAHYIQSYSGSRSGNLNASFHPKYFFSFIGKSSRYPIQKSAGAPVVKDEGKDCQLGTSLVTRNERGKSQPMSDVTNAKRSGSGSSQSCSTILELMKSPSLLKLEHDSGLIDHIPTMHSLCGSKATMVPISQAGSRSCAPFRTTTPIYRESVSNMRFNGCAASPNFPRTLGYRLPETRRRNEFRPKGLVNIDTKTASHCFPASLKNRRIYKPSCNYEELDEPYVKVKEEVKDDESNEKLTYCMISKRR